MSFPDALSAVPSWTWVTVAGVFGALIGSFLNVVILRLPDEQQSIVWPGSHCPKCGEPIAWYDNIPILSWLALRGKCRHCKEPISFRYVVVEALTAAAAVSMVLVHGVTLQALALFVFLAALIVVTFIDIDHRIIPNVISLPGIAVGIAVMPWVTELDWWPQMRTRLIGAAVGGGFLLATALLYELIRKREGMGMGDVKLLAMIGGWLGLKSIFFVVFVSTLIGSLVGIGIMVFQKKGMNASLPFGPYLSIGAVLYVFIGDHIVNLFLHGMGG